VPPLQNITVAEEMSRIKTASPLPHDGRCIRQVRKSWTALNPERAESERIPGSLSAVTSRHEINNTLLQPEWVASQVPELQGLADSSGQCPYTSTPHFTRQSRQWPLSIVNLLPARSYASDKFEEPDTASRALPYLLHLSCRRRLFNVRQW
jgi:hypothetical protein